VAAAAGDALAYISRICRLDVFGLCSLQIVWHDLSAQLLLLTHDNTPCRRVTTVIYAYAGN